VAAAETTLLLMSLAFNDVGGQRSGPLAARLREEGVVDYARALLEADGGEGLKVLGPKNLGLEDFR
jgi:hypothetical protein